MRPRRSRSSSAAHCIRRKHDPREAAILTDRLNADERELLIRVEAWLNDMVSSMDSGAPSPSENYGKWLDAALTEALQGKDGALCLEQVRRWPMPENPAI